MIEIIPVIHMFSTVSLSGGFLFSFLFTQIFPQWMLLRFSCYALSSLTGLYYGHSHMKLMNSVNYKKQQQEQQQQQQLQLLENRDLASQFHQAGESGNSDLDLRSRSRKKFPLIWALRFIHTTPWICLVVLEMIGVGQSTLVIQGSFTVMGAIVAARSGSYLVIVNSLGDFVMTQLDYKSRSSVVPLSHEFEESATENNKVQKKEVIISKGSLVNLSQA